MSDARARQVEGSFIASEEMLRDAVLEIVGFHHAGEQRRAVRLGGYLTEEARDDNEAGPSHEALDDPTSSAASTTTTVPVGS